MTDSPADCAEAAAIRRRWISLGEAVAVAGLLISALALWNSYADRRSDEAEKRAEKVAESRTRKAVLLTATLVRDGIALELHDPVHPVQAISVTFPTSLGIGSQSSAGTLRVESSWFASPLLSATRGGPDAQQGHLPVIIAADYWDGDDHITDRAIYDILWRTEGRLLRGRAVRLTGMVLRDRRDVTPARIDALWRRVSSAPPN